MFKPGIPVHPSSGIGTAPNAATTPQGIEISFDKGSNRNRQSTSQVIISNLEAAVGGNALEVSFANGQDGKWFSITPGQTVPINVMTHRCNVRGKTGATTAYSIMGIIS
jgi:hypothetical protein